MRAKTAAKRLLRAVTPRRLLYNEPTMLLARGYLERYFDFDTRRAWADPAGPPEWYDHRTDLYRFRLNRDAMFLERGAHAVTAMKPDSRVLDLCCGDGFYSFHFYSRRAAHIDAVDIDRGAIRHARRWHQASNIDYRIADLRGNSLGGPYDVIVWDGAIEHFDEDEQAAILGRCRRALGPGGVLVGYTIEADAHIGHPDHEHEFVSADDLDATLRRVFSDVVVTRNETPGRTNLYFRCA